MATSKSRTVRPAYVVFRSRGPRLWELVGEVPWPRGLPAREARRRAILTATGTDVRPKGRFAVLPRSEWRLAQRL